MTKHPINCKVGSAWHSWQMQAIEWLDRNPNPNPDKIREEEHINKEAHKFASDTAGLGPHSAVYGSKYRAFMEVLS